MRPCIAYIFLAVILFAGFSQEKFGNKVGLNLSMLGFNIGMLILVPAIYRDPGIFKKGK